MTLSEAITRAQKLKPDIYGDEILAGWISELDGKLSLELLHMAEPVSYRYPADAGTALLVPAPYNNVYELYIVAMTDFHNRQMDSYQNDMQMVNEAMDEYRAWYRRNNMPPALGGWKNL